MQELFSGPNKKPLDVSVDIFQAKQLKPSLEGARTKIVVKKAGSTVVTRMNYQKTSNSSFITRIN